jgi:hypothetical protein
LVPGKEISMKTVLRLSVPVVLLLLLLAACGGNADPSVAFCDSLNELQETAPTIAALGDAADLAQIVQLGAAMDNNWKSLSSAAEKMDDATRTAFAPHDAQYTAIPAITQETALPVARASLETKNTIANEAYTELYPSHCQ